MTRIAIDPDSPRSVGPISCPKIVVEDVNGGQWVLKAQFRKDDPRIRKTIRQIEAIRSIDPAHWTKPSKRY